MMVKRLKEVESGEFIALFSLVFLTLGWLCLQGTSGSVWEYFDYHDQWWGEGTTGMSWVEPKYATKHPAVL